MHQFPSLPSHNNLSINNLFINNHFITHYSRTHGPFAQYLPTACIAPYLTHQYSPPNAPMLISRIVYLTNPPDLLSTHPLNVPFTHPLSPYLSFTHPRYLSLTHPLNSAHRARHHPHLGNNLPGLFHYKGTTSLTSTSLTSTITLLIAVGIVNSSIVNSSIVGSRIVNSSIVGNFVAIG